MSDLGQGQQGYHDAQGRIAEGYGLLVEEAEYTGPLLPNSRGDFPINSGSAPPGIYSFLCKERWREV